MVTLSSFRRRLHGGENIGTTESHSIFVELKAPPPAGAPADAPPLGPGT